MQNYECVMISGSRDGSILALKILDEVHKNAK
jgi:hypothetical protein